MIRSNRPLTRAQAIRRYKRGHWKKWRAQRIAQEQMANPYLFVPWKVFHACVQNVLDRPVFLHEFVRPENLIREMKGDQ